MIDKAWVDSDRNIRTLESLQALYGHGRLANTGYVSILPVDQGIEHSAGASFAPNPLYFDPGNIVKLASQMYQFVNQSGNMSLVFQGMFKDFGGTAPTLWNHIDLVHFGMQPVLTDILRQAHACP